MKKASILIIHGLFEHKGRQEINASWFKELGIDSYLMDIPGHGNEAKVLGDISSWDEIDNSVNFDIFRDQFLGGLEHIGIRKVLAKKSVNIGKVSSELVNNLLAGISK